VHPAGVQQPGSEQPVVLVAVADILDPKGVLVEVSRILEPLVGNEESNYQNGQANDTKFSHESKK
jgi:hypothetical protein